MNNAPSVWHSFGQFGQYDSFEQYGNENVYVEIIETRTGCVADEYIANMRHTNAVQNYGSTRQNNASTRQNNASTFELIEEYSIQQRGLTIIEIIEEHILIDIPVEKADYVIELLHDGNVTVDNERIDTNRRERSQQGGNAVTTSDITTEREARIDNNNNITEEDIDDGCDVNETIENIQGANCDEEKTHFSSFQRNLTENRTNGDLRVGHDSSDIQTGGIGACTDVNDDELDVTSNSNRSNYDIEHKNTLDNGHSDYSDCHANRDMPETSTQTTRTAVSETDENKADKNYKVDEGEAGRADEDELDDNIRILEEHFIDSVTVTEVVDVSPTATFSILNNFEEVYVGDIIPTDVIVRNDVNVTENENMGSIVYEVVDSYVVSDIHIEIVESTVYDFVKVRPILMAINRLCNRS